MKVSEAIDRLEVGDTVWVKASIDEFNFEGMYIETGINNTCNYLDGNAEISLEEPREDKVEVPDFVAEKMKYYESALWMLASEYFDSSSEIDSEELVNWIDQNSEKFFRAWLDGYTVKPKRWVVTTTDSDTCYLKRFRMGKECLDGDISKVWVGALGWAFTFDDRAKADAVALLVDGSVEEV